jgi:hypothetical protein
MTTRASRAPPVPLGVDEGKEIDLERDREVGRFASWVDQDRMAGSVPGSRGCTSMISAGKRRQRFSKGTYRKARFRRSSGTRTSAQLRPTSQRRGKDCTLPCVGSRLFEMRESSGLRRLGTMLPAELIPESPSQIAPRETVTVSLTPFWPCGVCRQRL